MRASEQAGSAALQERFTALRGMFVMFCMTGIDPVTAAVLALFAVVVLTAL